VTGFLGWDLFFWTYHDKKMNNNNNNNNKKEIKIKGKKKYNKEIIKK